MSIKTYDIQIKDSPFEPNGMNYNNEAIAHYRKNNNKTLYKIFLYLEGRDLPFVKRVKYVLHKSFKNPIQIIDRNPNNPQCKLVLWTWGIFNVTIEIEYIDGGTYRTEHYLTYGDEIKNNDSIVWKRD